MTFVVERISALDGTLIAIFVLPTFEKEGANFISEQAFPLQLGVGIYRQGVNIKPHIHLKKKSIISEIHEVVHIEKGRAIVDLYDTVGKYIKSIETPMGTTILFVAGGHGFRMLEDTKLVEVKQGPYSGKEKDKVMLE